MIFVLMIFCIEFLQLSLRVGSFDIDDFILNVLGAGIGFVFFKVAERLLLRKNEG